ncbi:MAG: hypothetical protein II506_04165, partial [Lachnospiraceae bacterium]|nr:hypothetical protein [Lachnospiraceae bacterium]
IRYGGNKLHLIVNSNEKECEWFVDDCSLEGYINNLLFKKDAGVDKAVPAWTKKCLDYKGVQAVWRLYDKNKAIVPLYFVDSGQDAAYAVVVEVDKKDNVVYWDQIGKVQFDSQDEFETINKDKIEWYDSLDFEFERQEYERVLEMTWINETLIQLNNFHSVLDKNSCASLVSSLKRDGVQILEKHLQEYNQLLMDVYVTEELVNPLKDLIRKPSEYERLSIYFKTVELMWKYGNTDIMNVLEVTVLENLYYEDEIWESFCKGYTGEFADFLSRWEPI